MKLKPDVRRERILEAISANDSVRIPDLAREFGVSTETIRRDLDLLHSKRLVRRHFGGAIINPVGIEPTWSERLATLPQRKLGIARTAAELISDGEVLMLGAGSTTYTFAKRLALTNRRCLVFTNSISAGTCFPVGSRARVMLAPGEFDKAEGCTLGSETTLFLEKFWVDTAVLSVSGLSVDGGTEVIFGLSRVERTMIARSNRVILMVDHTKFGKRSVEWVCALNEIDTLVTDAQPPEELAEALRLAEVEVVVAEQPLLQDA
jgi:DeoR/GlpR family transcriptional regulator of sugar metabolism